MRISIVIFDDFTDIDLFLMWDLLNRVRLPEWELRIVGDNVATAGGCLAAPYIAGWVIEKKTDSGWKDLVLKSIQPVGDGLSFSDATELEKLYEAVPATAG